MRYIFLNNRVLMCKVKNIIYNNLIKTTVILKNIIWTCIFLWKKKVIYLYILIILIERY